MWVAERVAPELFASEKLNVTSILGYCLLLAGQLCAPSPVGKLSCPVLKVSRSDKKSLPLEMVNPEVAKALLGLGTKVQIDLLP